MRKLLIIGVGLVAAFVAACVLVVYAVTQPNDASTWRRRPPESPTSGAPGQHQNLVLQPDPTYTVRPPRPLQLPGYATGTGEQATGVPAVPKKPFDPVAHEEKRRAKREMMNRRRDGPPSGEDAD